MRVFNTLSSAVETFEPRDEGRVGIYVCGPTVQAAPHVGHGRYAVVFDVIRRYLTWRGYAVTYVMNVTDVDDKIIAAATEEHVSTKLISDRATEQFISAFDQLGVAPPDLMPRATEHIAEMIALIKTLVDTGHAYAADGDVYFSVRSFPDYGRLSGRKIDDLQVGARVEPGEHKRDPLDFALWKASKPGEPAWDAPWGSGRPGWHIECSAMATKYLGEAFDIHAGGVDLVFPHHENEVAQSEAATGTTFARYWLHNGMVNLSGEKMAKSTGNIIDLLSVLADYPPLAVRLFYLRTHYRKPIDFGDETLQDAVASLERLWSFRRRFGDDLAVAPEPNVVAAFRTAMDDDFDVAGALAVVFDAVRDGNRRLDEGEDAAAYAAAYDEIIGVLGLGEPEVSLEDVAGALTELATAYGIDAGQTPAETVDALIARRAAARVDKDWAVTDAIRDGLFQLGIVVEDTADGVRWYRR